jgi:hypothetical protein
VNEAVGEMECALEHFDVAMDMLAKLPTGTMLLKVDVSSAFRLVPVREKDRGLLGMMWDGMYYVDRSLPFGLSTSPPIWERVSRCLEWLVRKYVTNQVSHYVDDFLVAIPPGQDPEWIKTRVLLLMAYLGIPVSLHKLVGPSTRLEYLGIVVDTMTRFCEISPAKRASLLTNLRRIHKWEVKLKLLESTVGLLQFVTGVIRPGKAFIGRLRETMYKALNGTKRRQASSAMVKLGPVGKDDVKWWLRFLPAWPGRSYLPPVCEDISNSCSIVSDAWVQCLAKVDPTQMEHPLAPGSSGNTNIEHAFPRIGCQFDCHSHLAQPVGPQDCGSVL